MILCSAISHALYIVLFMVVFTHSGTMCESDESMEDLSTSGNGRPLSTGYPNVQNSGRERTRVLDFHSGRKCPTCGGTGKIPKGQDDELVALIPYRDKRLKPRRTWIFSIFVILCIIFAVLLLVGVFLAAFMFPRDVAISFSSCSELDSFVKLKTHPHSNTDINSDSLKENISSIILLIETNFSISNSNFFPIYLSQLNVTLSHFDNLIGNLTMNVSKSISGRKNKEVTTLQNATFNESAARKLFIICTDAEWNREIYLVVDVSVSYTYLTHTTDAVITAHTFIDCYVAVQINNSTNGTIT